MLGNLTAVTLPDSTQISYLVDGQGRRIGKKVNGVLVQGWLWQGQLAPVAELDGSGQVVSRFVYGTRVNVPDYMERGGETYRLVTNHLGSVELVVNASTGQVVSWRDYDEWGRVVADSNPDFQPFGFAGGLYNGATGLVRFGAREYDAFAARWTSKDPLGMVGGVNLFEYGAADPQNRVDPDGRFWHVLFGAALGAGLNYWANPELGWKGAVVGGVAGALGALAPHPLVVAALSSLTEAMNIRLRNSLFGTCVPNPKAKIALAGLLGGLTGRISRAFAGAAPARFEDFLSGIGGAVGSTGGAAGSSALNGLIDFSTSVRDMFDPQDTPAPGLLCPRQCE
ncbi:MAG: RHS repeat-associated core domain-containing protein [Gemmatimonadetes bacterium]|nr:RHS repeat-associated core domain-containing protein [Gemmatimonadota bacterium]MBK7717484.1 RHS repeat-associated core domain-containing protein [Gemmatimonadota bacterium]